jgi:hypothetical protein
MGVASRQYIDWAGVGHMPLIVGVDHDRREVSVIALGPVSLDDVREHLLHEKRESGLGYPELVDARGAGIPSTLAELQQIAEILRDLSREGPLGRTAFMVSSDADLDAMRALEAMVSDCCEMKAFRGEEEARTWLRGAAAKGQST